MCIQAANLASVVSMHNHIFSVVNVAERNLEHERLESISKLLERGLFELTWQSYGLDEFTEMASQTLHHAYSIVAGMKSNIIRITQILGDCGNIPLFTRNMQVRAYLKHSTLMFSEHLGCVRTCMHFYIDSLHGTVIEREDSD